MATNLRVLPGGREGFAVSKPLADKKELVHFRNVNAALLQDALNTWGDIWEQFQGSLTNGVMIVPEVEKSFEPEWGWPEFLEKMWLLRHYIDQAKRICEGQE
jgi:hypothetical protein